MAKTTGRPPKYKTPKEMEKVIEEYFERCNGIKALDDNGNPIITKNGYLYEVDPQPPTVTGLAYALGFTTRQALLNYQGKAAFVDSITRAKLYIERYAEMRLYDRDGAMGAKFSLANNFKGWKEKQETEISGGLSVQKGQLDSILEQLKDE